MSGLWHRDLVSRAKTFRHATLTYLSVTFASIFRATTIAASAKDPDPTWGPIPATIWSVIEANAGIVCACLPMLRSPFVRLFGPVFGRSRNGTTGIGGSHDITWRSDKPRESTVVSSRRRDPDETILDPGCDSEEVSLDAEPSALVPSNGSRSYALGRSSSGIFIRKEFSVDNICTRTASVGDRSTAASVSDDRSQGKEPHFHL